MCICHSLYYTCLSSSAIMCVNIIVQCSEIYLALKCLIINMTWLCNALSKVISPLWLMQISKTYTFKHIVTDTCVYIVVTCVSPLCPFVILWVMRACLLFKGGLCGSWTWRQVTFQQTSRHPLFPCRVTRLDRRQRRSPQSATSLRASCTPVAASCTYPVYLLIHLELYLLFGVPQRYYRDLVPY